MRNHALLVGRFDRVDGFDVGWNYRVCGMEFNLQPRVI